MSLLEDEIRDTLRSKAASLREVRPLQLPSVASAHEPRAVPRPRWAHRLRTWQGPAVAAAVIVLVAATLVTLRSLRNEHAAPAASPGPSPAASATPRYYVTFGWAKNPGTSAILVGDEQTGKTLATFPLLPKGNALSSPAVGGAADDRTFVVSGATSQGSAVPGPPTWHLVRIFPGSAHPVRITTLPIKFPADENVRDIALSAAGTELAVVSNASGNANALRNSSGNATTPVTLRVYSVATGRLQHSWYGSVSASDANPEPIADLSWVGDSTVGFAVTYSPEVREEVRTLDVTKTGASLFADSHLVWSQYVRAAPPGARNAPHACDTPFLTPNGQAVVCGNSTYSASDKRWSAVWLAYPLATQARPRVIGSVREPRDVSGFNGPIEVDWANSSGTEMIVSWNTVAPVAGGESVANYQAVIENGKVKHMPHVPGPASNVAW
jgi:hypothetical protein